MPFKGLDLPQGYKQKKAFIVAEGPMQITCGTFWKMVHQQGCGTIVMLSNTIEYKKVNPIHLGKN